MNKDLLIKKLQAFFHDPPEKALILGLERHESRGLEIINRLLNENLSKLSDGIKMADYIASAADRINFPTDENFYASFRRDGFIKHPLSGKEFRIGNIEGYSSYSIDLVNKFLDDIKSKYNKNLETLYLAIWRLLRERLVNEDKKIGYLWDLLPADSRVPDHSIWEHTRITSAIAGALPNPSFIIFSIGPVQDFIAIARKTQDLWASSYILSYLSWCAMKVFAEQFGPDCIIFPDLLYQPFVDKWLKNEKGIDLNEPANEELSSPSLPNRFLAVIPSDAVESLSKKAKEEVNKTFYSICNAVKERIAKDLSINSAKWNEIWNRQISKFLEVYWVALPTNNGDYKRCYEDIKSLMGMKDDSEFDLLLKQYIKRGFSPNIGTIYGLIYRFIERSIGSRKSIRDFVQTSEPNYKCTLCGVREPVHTGVYGGQDCSQNFGALRSFWQEFLRSKYTDIRKSERLCAVCLTKRFSSKFYFKDVLNFQINDTFPSVSMVSTSSFKLDVINFLNDNSFKVKLKNYIELIKEITNGNCFGSPLPKVARACGDDEIFREFAKLDGEWLFRETLENEHILIDEYSLVKKIDDLGILINEARKRLDEVFDEIKKFNAKANKKIELPAKYYAVILMDGDNMGKWLSGEYAPKIGDILHRTLNSSLSADQDWQQLLSLERPLNPSLHLTTSRALRDFSLKVVREIVERDHLGKIVYSGGDDVLAFVDLRDLPDVMRKLRAYFTGNIRINEKTNKIEVDFSDKGSGFVPIDERGFPLSIGKDKSQIKGYLMAMGTNATASMGVVIAHHNSNLYKILNDLRKTEKMAKGLDGKNAFSILLNKRSGGSEYARFHWYYPKGDNIFETILIMKDWIESFNDGLLSPKFVYDLQREANGLENLGKEAIMIEIKRMIKRHWEKNKEGDKEFERINRMLNGIMVLYGNNHKINEILNLLVISAFIARQEGV